MVVNLNRVTVDIPAPIWDRFVKATDRQDQSAQEVLLRLLQNYAETDKQTVKVGVHAQLTRRYFQETLRRTEHINAILFDTETVDAIQTTYGTTDAVELIERVRNRQC